MMPWAMRKQIDGACQILEQAFDKHPWWYCPCSFGKDSSIVVWLLHEHFDWSGPVVFMDSGYAFPETYDYMDRLQREWNLDIHRIPSPVDYLDIIRKYGLITHLRGASRQRKVIQEIKSDPLTKWGREHGYPHCIWGIRADETSGRRCLLRKRGAIYEHDNSLRCAPLAWWTAADVWRAYDLGLLPLNPLYTKSHLLPRNEIKNGSWLTCDRANHGRIAWLKDGWPELYNRLAAQFPEVRSYV